MTASKLRGAILEGSLDSRLGEIYRDVPAARDRYAGALSSFTELFGDKEVAFFSVPGRSEIIGNHTDHQHGRVVAAAVNLDIIAVAAANGSDTIRVKSEGFPCDEINVSDVRPDALPKYSSSALIAGVCAGIRDAGGSFGGFDAYTTSQVLKGSGLSSSAAFEVMTGTIVNHLFNGGRFTPVELAKIGQFAENKYFGKPCGLMDQTACAVGGFVAIDFLDPAAPVVEKLSLNLHAEGYTLCITDTGGSHADLNDDYASIPAHMKSVAGYFGQEVLRGIAPAQILANAKQLRARLGDKAVLRALHFTCENERAKDAADALRSGDTEGFFSLLKQSGDSSFKYLQNVYTDKAPNEQGLSLALAAASGFLGDEGACRVHGGGFAGTIQAFVPNAKVSDFAALMDGIFGEGSCHVLDIRDAGGVLVVGS
ncbi:MAG: galactokinase [Eubacteriales bacterium]